VSDVAIWLLSRAHGLGAPAATGVDDEVGAETDGPGTVSDGAAPPLPDPHPLRNTAITMTATTAMTLGFIIITFSGVQAEPLRPYSMRRRVPHETIQRPAFVS
jgi:hypothetical protein